VFWITCYSAEDPERTHACSQLLQFPEAGRQEECFFSFRLHSTLQRCTGSYSANHAEEKRVFSVAGLVGAGPSESETYTRPPFFTASLAPSRHHHPTSLVNSEAGVCTDYGVQPVSRRSRPSAGWLFVRRRDVAFNAKDAGPRSPCVMVRSSY
jgi:hypothetical protein